MRTYKVYLIRNKAKDIVYCGLTSRSLTERLRENRFRLKLDISHTIELVAEDLDPIQAALLERRLIEHYRLREFGRNQSAGSKNGGITSHTKKNRAKWSKERRGIPVSPEHAAKNRIARLGHKNGEVWRQAQFDSHAKAVICIETGVVYPSARHAAKHLNLQYSKISMVCNGQRISTGNLHFAFYKKR